LEYNGARIQAPFAEEMPHAMVNMPRVISPQTPLLVGYQIDTSTISG
jgi:hypothetical protein